MLHGISTTALLRIFQCASGYPVSSIFGHLVTVYPQHPGTQLQEVRSQEQQRKSHFDLVKIDEGPCFFMHGHLRNNYSISQSPEAPAGTAARRSRRPRAPRWRRCSRGSARHLASRLRVTSYQEVCKRTCQSYFAAYLYNFSMRYMLAISNA